MESPQLKPRFPNRKAIPPRNKLRGFLALLFGEAGAYRPYKDILRGVVERYGAAFGFDGHAERNALVDTFGNWKPFFDTVAALQILRQHYKLAILSNVDDNLFALTAPQLEVPFDAVFTAEQIGSYKPSLRNFECAQRHLGVTTEAHLHVAQSLYHDVAPARSLGITTVWVNRRPDKVGAGATFPTAAQPDWEVPDLRTFATQVQQAFAPARRTAVKHDFGHSFRAVRARHHRSTRSCAAHSRRLAPPTIPTP